MRPTSAHISQIRAPAMARRAAHEMLTEMGMQDLSKVFSKLGFITGGELRRVLP